MRPVSLSLQAFGPYSGTEVVDFTELGPNRVFLIHGDTGAGKTTILDAMVFALYGDTSGGERRADQMRSDLAPADLPTEVVFDFSLGPKRYRIKRRPAQDIQGTRSAGLVSKPAEAALWDRTGCEASAEGVPLATKIRDVETHIKELLGFSCEQFRQVVVLPQGRFRELLSSGSDKREEILLQLFRTERFRELEIALAERAKSVRKQMEELRMRRLERLESAGAADDAELSALIEEAAARLESSARGMRQAETAARLTADALAAAEAASAAHRALRDARAALVELEGRGEEIAGVRRRVEAGGRADKVRPAAEKCAVAAQRVLRARAAHEEAVRALGRAQTAEADAVKAAAAEEARAPERHAVGERVRYLEGLAGAIEAWSSAQGERDEAARRVQACSEAVKEAQQAQENAAKVVADLENRLEDGKAATVRLDAARGRHEQAKRDEDRCARLVEAEAAVSEAEARLAELAQVEADAAGRHRQAQADLALADERWRSGRAAALAAALVPGEPCPVCGSKDHPAPAASAATDAMDNILEASRSTADSARQAYEQAREAAGGAKTELAKVQAREESLRQEMGAGLGVSLPDVRAAVAACVAEVQTLEAQADVGPLEVESEAAREKATAAAAAAAAAGEALTVAREALARAEERLRERAAGIPEDLRTPGALQDELVRRREERSGLEAAFKTAGERAGKAKESRIASEEAVRGATSALAEAEEDDISSRGSYGIALDRGGFASEDEWQRCLLSDEERSGLDTVLGNYDEALQQAKGRLQQAEKSVEGRPEPADLAALREAAEQTASEHSTALSAHADAKSRVGVLGGVRDRLREIDASSEEVRRAYETVGALADAANGQNPSRISLQRWVLGVYLDEVLVAASRRLHTMSKGRYRLERQQEAAGRGRASGLDLAAFDEFSGAPRPAVTLSGGESFLAALALALGLAETVQEHAAGVPLETIFVDEGFGALDPDALELAVDALMELESSGRLVGVISHVPELRQVIPARLEVRGGPSGSRTRFIVP